MKPAFSSTFNALKVFFAPIVWISVVAIVFFSTANQINILRAWVYFVLYAIGGLLIGFLLLIKSPKLLSDRGTKQESSKQIDLLILILFFLCALVITPLTAGIDFRFNITDPISFNYLYLAIVLYLLSAVFATWPMLHNPFFEGTIRIQKEKNHHVINTGPYKIIRHPGYLGMILGAAALPIALGSMLAFIPTAFQVILVIFRTYYEDKTLQNELNGYSDYCAEVKYRLFLGIW